MFKHEFKRISKNRAAAQQGMGEMQAWSSKRIDTMAAAIAEREADLLWREEQHRRREETLQDQLCKGHECV